ncbi:MAG: polysaccharide biosynthesis tyrosine autokinase, partial [Ginsengibacter sp.]
MEEDQFFKEKTETNIFKQVIYKYLPFWPLFIVSVSISLLIAYINLRAQVPMYVAAGKVLLKDPNKGGGDSKVLDALNIFSEKKIVDNEIIVLRSTDVMQEVVKELDLFGTVYNKGNVRTEELYKANSPIEFKVLNKDNFNAWDKYFFSIDWQKKMVLIDNKRVAFDSTVVLGKNVIRLAINHDYNPNVIGKNYFVQFAPASGKAGSITPGLSISPYSYSSTVLNVSLSTPVPEKGVDILAKLFQIYNKDAIEDKNQIAVSTLQFIDDRLALVTFQLDSVEKHIAGLKSNTSVVDLSSQAGNYFSKVKTLDEKNSQLDLQLEMLSDVNNYARGKGKNTGTVPSLMLLNDGTLSGLLDKLYTAEVTAENLQSVTGERNDAFILAKAEITRIKDDIFENIGNIRKNILTEKRQVNAQISENNYLLQAIPQKERVFLDISRQQAIKNNIYTYLLQKREETALSSASTSADLRVVEAPYSYGPISPIAKNFYLTGLIVGLLSGAFIVLLKEVFSRKVLFRSEIEDKVKAPIMGEIVQVAGKDPIVILDGKRTIIAEQFRSIRTNLSFMGLNEDHNTLMITSSVSGEGKSFIAINLAISLTLTGKKVALMELDLRKPKLSKILKVSKTPGISSYLVNKATVEEITKQTEVPNLFVVSAGPIPPNPTELISGPKFQELIAGLKQRFDYVIMDTAPVSPVTDAQLLQAHADINVFVVRHGVTPRVFLTMIDGLNQQKKFKNMCIVFNGIKPRGFHIYGYGF